MWCWCKDMAKQADLQELAQTAFVAVVFGFMISKLLSMLLAIRSSMKNGSLRIERVPLQEEEEAAAEERVLLGEADNGSFSSSDEKEDSVHSADSDGDRADVSGLSEGRADYSEVSESGGIDESSGAGPTPQVVIKKHEQEEQERISGHQSLAPAAVDFSEAGYEPSTSSCGEAEDHRPGLKSFVHPAPPPAEEDDTSDWEGVESTELDEAFGAASSYLATIAGGLKVPTDIQLQLYGLYKVATEGPCHTPQPSALKMTARAKWNAWQKLGSISQEEAMERYVEIVTAVCPEWLQKTSKSGEGSSGTDPKKGPVGPVFSTLNYEDKNDDGTLEALHVAAREGNESNVVELLDQGVPVELRDSDGRTPLHWAADRGHLNIVDLLLSRGADIQAKDKEGQSALHYATICEQEQVAKLLCSRGADPEAKDDDGATPMSFCPSGWSSWMMHSRESH